MLAQASHRRRGITGRQLDIDQAGLPAFDDRAGDALAQADRRKLLSMLVGDGDQVRLGIHEGDVDNIGRKGGPHLIADQGAVALRLRHRRDEGVHPVEEVADRIENAVRSRALEP